MFDTWQKLTAVPHQLPYFLLTVFSALSMTSQSERVKVETQVDLIKAIEQRDVAAVKSAIDKGANVNAPGDFNRTPLHLSAQSSTAEINELLLQRGANPNARDDNGRTPLHLANSMSAEILLRHKADASVVDKQGNSPLHTAAEEDAVMCQLLVRAGVKVDIQNNSGLTPLHFAALRGVKNPAEFLLSQGADINAKTKAKYSFKWTYVAWDVKGMEVEVPAGSTPIAIAREHHKKNKWVSQRYKTFADFLASKGAVEKKGWWPF